MTTFAQDTFTAASDTALESHTPDVGATWVEHGSYVSGSAQVVAATDRLVHTSFDDTVYYVPSAPGSANYSVAVTIHVETQRASAAVGVCGRVATGANTRYEANFNAIESPDVFRLSKFVAGSETSLGTYAATVADGDVLTLDMSGTTIRLLINAVERVSVTDSAIAAAGYPGVRFYDFSGGGSTVGYHIDNFAANDVVVDVAPTISSVVATPGAITATVTWTTDEVATSRVYYGTASHSGTTITDANVAANYGSSSASDATADLTSHSIGLTGLTASTTYYGRVRSADVTGPNVAYSAEFSFTTGAADTTPPVVSLPYASPVKATSATLRGTTDEAATSQYRIGTATGVYGSAQTMSGSAVTTHSVPLTGLTANTAYFWQMRATDGSANTSAYSAEQTFTTPAASTLVNLTLDAVQTWVTFSSIGVEVAYSGSATPPTEAALRFRKVGDVSWRNGLPLWRANTAVQGTSKAYYGSVLLCDPGSAYQVEVTVSDGASGTATEIYGATTRAEDIPAASSLTPTRYVDAATGSDSDDGLTSGNAWATYEKARASAPSGAVVQFAPGRYTVSYTARTLPWTIKAQYPAVTNDPGRDTAPTLAAVANRAIMEDWQAVSAPGSNWVSTMVTGPTGVARQVWYWDLGVAYADDYSVFYSLTGRDGVLHRLVYWEGKSGTFTPSAGAYAGLTFSLGTAADWRDVVAVNDQQRYGFAAHGTRIYAVFPPEVTDPNAIHTFYTTTKSGNHGGIALNGAGRLRVSGFELRVCPVTIQTGCDGAIVDHCYLQSSGITTAGYSGVTPSVYSTNTVIEHNQSDDTGSWSTDVAYPACSWNWMKLALRLSGQESPWQRVGATGTENGVAGGAGRLLVCRHNWGSGYFNGLSVYNVNYDRYSSGEWDVYDNVFRQMSDDAFEPEQQCINWRVWGNRIERTATVFSTGPANFGPFYLFLNEIWRNGAEGVGADVSNGNKGVGVVGFKYGGGNNVVPPRLYVVNNTFWTDSGGDGAGQFAGGGPNTGLFWMRNNIFRYIRYSFQAPGNTAAQKDRWDSEHNLYTTVGDASHHFNYASGNQTTVATYRTASGTGATDNLLGGVTYEFRRTDITDALFVDATAGNLDLIGGSIALDAGIAVANIIDRAGTDFGGAAPNLGAWQTTGSPPADTSPPTVISTNPVSGATSVAIAVSPTVTFNEAMDAATITTSTVRVKVAGTPVAAVVTYDAPTRTATINPNANLANATAHTIDVEVGAEDAAGNAIASAFTSAFTTIALPDVTTPTVLAVSPVDGATGVPVNVTVSLTVSEALAAGTVTTTTVRLLNGATPVAGAVGYTAGGTTITLDPTADLSLGTVYTVQVTTGITDVAGNALVQTFTSAFTTVASSVPVFSAPTTEQLVSFTVAWMSDIPTTTQLAYGPTAALGSVTTLDTALDTVHEATLLGLPGLRVWVQALGSGGGQSAVVALTVPGKRRGGLLRN